MALFDDRRFLLSHINHSFITGDDTGVCEVVMLDEDVIENQHQICLKLLGQNDDDPPESRLDPEAYDLNYESELFESEQGQSYDIASDLDYICHRRRSNTAQRLDRLKKDKINQSKTRTIVWRCSSPTNSQSEERLSHDSPTSESNEICPATSNNINNSNYRKSKSPPSKSGLTRLLERFPSLPKNPFNEYAQFDGGMSESVPVKKILIYIAINDQIIQQQQNQQQPQNNTPLEVVIVSTAKVQDLIGLICWQYTNEGREPKLDKDISRYCLRITEDTGEVDPDFPSLKEKEPLSKFDFPSLALTDRKDEKTGASSDPEQSNVEIRNNRAPRLIETVMSSGVKITNPTSKWGVLTRLIFKDAILDSQD